MTTTILHRETLEGLRAIKRTTTDEAHVTIVRLLDHIDAMREHTCFYKWSDVKAAKHGDVPAPRCVRCGYESPTRRAKAEADALTAFLDQAAADHHERADRVAPDPDITVTVENQITHVVTIADGTRGMERGR